MSIELGNTGGPMARADRTVPKTTIPGPLADLIRGRREALGLSGPELADLVGKSRSFIWRLERGDIPLTNQDTIQSMAEALGLSPDDLYAAGRQIPHDIIRALETMDARQLTRARRALDEIMASETQGE